MEGDSGFPSPAIIDESSREALEVLQICTNYSIFNQIFSYLSYEPKRQKLDIIALLVNQYLWVQ